jgi:predicted dehydrogenase
VLDNPAIDTAFIMTRHSSHARLASDALRAGKHVFVEKPLAIGSDGLEEVRKAFEASADRLLMVGFNRRFAPMIAAMKRALSGVIEPSSLIITVNAGRLPSSHWTVRPEEGGRIIGEGCHFVDLARFLIGHSISTVRAIGLPAAPGTHASGDSAIVALGFEDGSTAAIHYLANGAASFPKERVELFNGGRILQMENYLALRPFGWPGVKASKVWRQDKGHRMCVSAFMNAVRGGEASPIPAAEIFEVHQATFEAARQLAVSGDA